MKSIKPVALAFLTLWLALAYSPAQTPAPATPAAAPAVAASPQPWPQDGSDLKPDPNAVYGILPNGLRYVIFPNKEPPGRVSLRLRVNAGSFMENDNQRGLAHFLEHMAFNGSQHFPPGDIVTFLQRLGMGFGADTNAHTSFDETVYQLDLPDNTEKLLRSTLQLMSDDANGLLIPQDKIDSERGVILSEKRDRDNVDYRLFVAGWNFYYPDARLPLRLPIGEASVISAANRDLFVDFYNKWYTPDRIILVVVGDVKPADIVPLITEYFGPIAPRPRASNPDLGNVASPDFKASYHKETEAPDTQIQLLSDSVFARGPDRAARRANQMLLDTAEFIIDRRLERIALQPNAPITKGDAFDYTEFNAVDVSGIEVECQPAQWNAALDVLEQQLRLALQYGFTDAEINEAKANTLEGLEKAVKEESTRKDRDLADEIAGTFEGGEVFTSPDQDLAFEKPLLDALTPQQCLDAFKAAWSHSGRRLFMTGSTDITDADSTLAAAYQKSAAVAVEKPVENTATTFAYTSTGEPGKVVERNEIADLGITQLRFANNVRVNLKKTDFEAGKILVQAQFGGGKLTLPADKPALAFMAGAVFSAGGLGQHSADDLKRLLAGKNVGADFDAGDNYFGLSGDTDTRDLRLELELLKAYLTDPGYRPESLALARRGLPQFFNDLRQNVDAVMANDVDRFIASGDIRFGYPTQEQAEAITLDDVRTWLAPALKDSYLEISIVGDFDPAATEAALAATFGTLSPRAEKRADYTAALNVQFPTSAAGQTKTFNVPTAIPKAVVATYWPTTDSNDIDRARRLNVLGEIFTDRMRVQIRQAMGDAYSPEAGNNASYVYPKYGYTLALITADPAKTAVLADKERQIGNDLATGGVTQDEFDRAIIPLQKSIVEQRRRNIYWLGRVMAGSQAKPAQLDWARSLPTAYDKITPAEITALAKEYLGADKAVQVLVLPQTPPAK